MKCDKCGKNDAVMNVKAIINGVDHDYHLCGDCAMELRKTYFDEDGNFKGSRKEQGEHIMNFMKKFVPNLDEIIDSYYDFKYRKNNYNYDMLSKLSDKTCPSCGNSLSNIRSGVFGCPDCYKLDKKLTNKILKTYNNYSTYEGSYPRAYRKFKEVAIKVKDLQEKLNQSVETEDYERAANIKEKIDELNTKVQN
ncbi:MAG: UvrB/UvrC motif-containing protein [Anaerococcus sp.]|nr:UvrB/UvrC motif-containing protein [Anaerococcus sp.]